MIGCAARCLIVELLDAGERVVARHHDVAVPAIARQQRKAVVERLRARGDREVDAIERGHLGDLLGGALVQVQAHLRVLLAELLDDLRQHVARLCVRGRDRQRATLLVLEIVGKALDVLHLAQDPDRAVDDLLPGGSDARQVAAVADEDLETELVLEQLDLLADARLRRVQLLGRRRDVEAGLGDRGEVAQLVQFHRHILCECGAFAD